MQETIPNTSNLENTVIEAGEETSDVSDTGSSFATDTTSITSSVVNYQYENGRRYHNYRSGSYVLPNDQEEQERLDMGHHAWSLLLRGNLYLAPLDASTLKRALDIGTGTGIWAIDFGDEFPECEVIGTDLSPIQPRWVPPNVKFEVDDAEAPWAFSEKFDYIHGRNLIGGIKDWKKLFEQCYENLNPGGYLEFHESDIAGVFSDDGSFKGTSFERYQENIKAAGHKIGQRMDIAPELSTLIREVGFLDVQETKIKWPFGLWPKEKRYKELGLWGKMILEPGMEAYGLALFTRVLGMSGEEAKELCDKAAAELGDKKIHMVEYQYAIVGRKPRGDESP